MHPALSVIFFTVTSGAGFGLFTLLVLMSVFGFGAPLAPAEFYAAGITALALTSLGLMSSTLHLANPKNAWRAFFRFKTSWLSREGVFAVLFYPPAFIYIGGYWLSGNQHNLLTEVMGVVAGVLALITIFSTGMIYACLKTMRQWNTSLTPTNYLLIGLATGGLVLTMIRLLNGVAPSFIASLTLALMAAAAVAKLIYYFWIGKPKGATIKTATGFTRAGVKMLDVGHTAGTFLTKEFGYEVSPSVIMGLRSAVFLFGFILPAAFLIAWLGGGAGVNAAIAAVVSTFVGMAVERWLFFAEARHVVMLYHGYQRT